MTPPYPHPRQPMVTSAPRRAAVWLLYRSRDMDTAGQAYSNRRLTEAAARAGLTTEIVHPRRVDPAVFRPPHAATPLAVLGRAGTRHGRSGKRLLKAAEVNGILTLPTWRAVRRSPTVRTSPAGSTPMPASPTRNSSPYARKL